MIKPIEYDDVFGYDDAGRPCAVQLHNNLYAFGYDFCGQLRPLLDQGHMVAHRLFTEGEAFVFVYSPDLKTAELWQGEWKEDAENVYSIVNPELTGLTERKFETFDDLKEFAKSNMPSLTLVAGSLLRK